MKIPAPESGRKGRLVVDAPIRMFHVLFALCFFGAWLTSESEAWRSLHVTLGYSMAGLLLFRIVYGLFGPPQARLCLLFGRLKGLLGMFPGKGEERAGGNTHWTSRLGALQNVSMAAVVLALIVLAAITCVSGYLAWNDAPEWVAELHEEIGEALITLGVIHLIMLFGFSLIRKRNLALPMLTGRIAGPGPSIVQHNRAWLALVILVAVCAFGVYDLRQKPVGAFTDLDSARVSKKSDKHEYSGWQEKREERHDRDRPKRKREHDG
ncbi:MAG: cytochrome b/b6 domain-containing protein [Betaproteobacteria bacterium]|nr:cytochrome b/b6 domain-containing protein [Betaproteobacteria bacterium]